VKVLHVIPTYPPAWRYGGPMRSVHGLATALAALGDRVTVFTTNVDGPHELSVPVAQPVPLDGVEVWYFPVGAPRRLGRSPAMARALRRSVGSFDLVHLHSVFLWPTLAAARACARAEVPYVLSPRGMLVPDLIARRGRLRKTLWLALFERKTVRDAAAIIVSSELEGRELAALALDEPPLEVIPNGLSPEEPGSAGDVGTVAGMVERQPLVLYLGRLSWKKGVDVVIAAIALLPGAQLAIAGNDDEGLRTQLERLARDLGVSQRVVFLGEVRGRAKAMLLAASRMVVLPSMGENFGMAALEAMAAGLPVVLTPSVGLAATIREAGAGTVCDRTPEAVAAALGELIARPDLARAMGERGRDVATARFSWPAIAAATRIAYERAIQGRRRRLAGGGRDSSPAVAAPRATGDPRPPR
jgi:glycosyltransferase involved in cell wall biosynthesis